MKKILPVLLLVAVAAALWFTLSSQDGGSSSVKSAARGGTTAGVSGDDVRDGMIDEISGRSPGDRITPDGEDEEGLEDYDQRSAIERYQSLEEALKAARDGAVDYDDLVLDQFTELPLNCSWCDDFYREVKDLLLSADTKPEQKSYYAELMAISGRMENIQTLVDAIKGAKNQEDADIFAEALELTIGKDDTVKFLGDQLDGTSDTLREASIAAITNQGSRLAIELLHSHTVKRGDPDGYYSVGIGMGEVVPEPDAYPYLQELVGKRDQYSHLAVKALLNSGIDGLKMVVDSLSASPNADFDAQVLESAKDHVTFDDETMAYLQGVAEKSQNQAVQAFARETISEFQEMEAEADEDDFEDEEPFTPMQP
jgi:hypothetical protein